MTLLRPRPPAGNATGWAFPPSADWGEPGALRGRHLEIADSGMLHLAVYFPACLATEPRDREGVTELITRGLFEGAGPLGAQRFGEEVDRIAGSLWADAFFEGVVVGLDVLESHAERGVELLAAGIRDPHFDDREIARHRTELLSDIHAARSSNPRRAALAFDAVLHAPSDRRSRPIGGDADTVSALDRAAVVERAGGILRADKAVFLSVGGGDTSRIRALIDRHFGTWRAPDASGADDVVPPPQLQEPRTVLIDRPGSGQSAIRAGRGTIDRHHRDWPALRLSQFVLGDGLTSRLNAVLREQRGYTYGVQTECDSGAVGGTFSVSGTFGTDVTGLALAELNDILGAYRAGGPTDDEVARAIDAIRDRTPISFQAPRALHRSMVAAAQCAMPFDWPGRLVDDVAGLEPAEVAAAFDRRVPPALTTVVVGDAERCRPLLRDAGIVVDEVRS